MPEFALISISFQVGNTFTVATANFILSLIICTKLKLRTQGELLVIAYYCFNEALNGYSGTFFSSRRVLMTVSDVAWPLVPRMACVLNPAFVLWLFTGYSIPLAEILLTFDRIWALYFPLSYSRTSLKRVFITINVISLVSLLLAIFDIAESWIEESGKTTMISPGCYLDAFTKITYYGSYFAKGLLYLICCTLYMPVLWKVRKIMSTSMNRKMRATVRGSLAIGETWNKLEALRDLYSDFTGHRFPDFEEP
ncbi:unnamed protein product, partial [Mesorhabditis belari]|uniref:G-protein coupled receptors family 1 profile domain-containing protein n=1 Tax=Mesorhabditis belari TaxID=2138241 RepID=A0AAF3EJM8_9BILA